MQPSDRERLERLEEQIRELAYSLWEAGGRQHGRSLEHWLDAERQILTVRHAARHAGTVVEAVSALLDAMEKTGDSRDRFNVEEAGDAID